MRPNFIPFRTTDNFYIYDLIYRNIEVCDELTYSLYTDLYQNNCSDLKKEILNKEKYRRYSTEQLNKAFAIIKTHMDYDKKHFKLNFYQTGHIQKEDILRSLSNTKQIILEITRKCNLRCVYCCYGPLYKKVNISKRLYSADTPLNYLRCILNLKREFNREQKEVIVTFYGGEALIEMETIKKVVLEVSKYQLRPTYTITTNGVLLDKYIDFLVEHNFKISISLDGGFKANSYRIFPNGKESFSKISANIAFIRNKYPQFYKSNISFLTVLHNRNNVLAVNDYFSEIHSHTQINSLSEHGVRKDKHDRVQKMVHDYRYSEEEISLLKNKYPMLYKEQFDTSHILYNEYFSEPEYDDIGSLILNKNRCYPGQTCYLFKKRVFVTIDGLLLPCERIERKYSLGRIIDGKIYSKANKATKVYKDIETVFSKSCSLCVKRFSCSRCFFQDEDFYNNKACFKDEETARTELSYLVSTMEEML